MKHNRFSNYKCLCHIICNCFCFFIRNSISKTIFTKVFYNRQDVRISMIMSNSAIEFDSICLVSFKSWILSDILNYSFSFLYSLKHLTWLSIFTKAFTFLLYIFGQETFSLLDKYSHISLFFRCDLVDLCALSIGTLQPKLFKVNKWHQLWFDDVVTWKALLLFS